MTTTDNTSITSQNARWPMFAAAGAGIAVVLTAIGTYWDIDGNDTGPKDGLGAYLIVVAMIAVGTAIVFAVETRAARAVTSLVLGVLAVLTVVVAWTGLPAVLAAGSVAAALGAPRRTAPALIGLALSTLALVGAIAFAIAG